MPTTPTILTSLLVGAHFHPPAKLLLEHLPTGTPLELIPEPDNPYDESGLALGVWLRPEAVPESQWASLRETLPGMGQDWDQVLFIGEPLQLGHLAKSGGKPLAGTDYVGTEEWNKGGSPLSATLHFDPQGRALLVAQSREVTNEMIGISLGFDQHGSGGNV